MFLLVIFALALASVPVAGGRLTRLAALAFRGTPLVLAALGLQILIISVVPHWDSWLHDAIHLGTYGLAAAFLWLNRAVPGLVLAGAGGALNFAAIAANGGVMPAREGALRTAGLEYGTGDFENSTVVADASLAFLGDVFAIPDGWPLANVFSIGDVVLVAGVLWGLHAICGSRAATRVQSLLRTRPRPAERVEDSRHPMRTDAQEARNAREVDHLPPGDRRHDDRRLPRDDRRAAQVVAARLHRET